MKLFKKYATTPIDKALLLLLILQLCLMTFCNLTLTDASLDCDNAKLFRHIIEMWRNKTLFIPDWKYSTTLEYDCVTLFALPLYGITKNIYLACGLSNMLLTGIFIASLFFLFSGKKFLYPLLCANLICIPYGISMLGYYNMMFFCGSQYGIKVLIPLLLAGVLLSLENTAKTKFEKNAELLFTLLYILLLLLTSLSSGSYVALCGLIPIFLVYFGYKFFRQERISRGTLIVTVTSLICAAGGICLNAYLGGTRGSGMELCTIYSLLANVSNTFFGLFELFGGTTVSRDVAVLSYEGIVIVSRIFFVLALLVCGMVAFARCLKKNGDLRTFLLLSVFLWNYLILNIVSTRAGSQTYEYRYHLVGAIPLICIACIVILDGILSLNSAQQGILYGGGVAALLFLCTTGYVSVFAYGEQNQDLKELTEYCASLDIDHAYMYEASNDSEICRVLDLETQYIYVNELGVTKVYDYYNVYEGGEVQPLNSIIVVDNAQYNLGDAFTIPRYQLKKFAEVGNRSLYYFDL